MNDLELSRLSELRLASHRREGEPWFWAAFAVLLVLSILPFIVTQTPALGDYPNHLARIFILTHIHPGSVLARYYQPHWRLIPDLGMDALGMALGRILPIYAAGQAILVIAVLLLAAGLVALSAAAFGRPRPFCLLGFFFIFSAPMQAGFINFVLGCGLALLGAAGWIVLRRRSLVTASAFAVPMALAIYLTHLFAFGAYGLIVAGAELRQISLAPRRWDAVLRTVAAGIAQAAVPVWLLLRTIPSAPHVRLQYGSFAERLITAPFVPVRAGAGDALDIATVLVLLAIVAFGLASRRLVLSPQLLPSLCLLLAACVAVPSKWMGAEGLEMRFPLVFALAFVAAADLHLRGERELALVFAVPALLFCLRTAIIVRNFLSDARFVAALDDALRPVPVGARLAAVVLKPESGRSRPIWHHAICYQVIQKDAFVPTLFINPSQQPLAFNPPYAAQKNPPDIATAAKFRGLPAADFANAEYLVIIDPALLRSPIPAGFQPFATGADFKIWMASRR